MDWNEYRTLCDSPRMFSRWMLEQTIELISDEPSLARALANFLRGLPLDKPTDHRGGAAADMFEVGLCIEDAQRVHSLIHEAASIGRRTAATRSRGLGGFTEAWREYAAYVERHAIFETDTDQEIARMSHAAKVVTDLIGAFNKNDLDRIMTYFTDDAVYHNIPMASVSGLTAIRAVLQGFLGLASQVDWRVRHLAEDDAGVVLTERVDRFLINGKWLELPVMGTFEVVGNKIKAWRDYFDMNQFQSQLVG